MQRFHIRPYPLLLLAALFVAGCGSRAGASPRPTAVPRSPTLLPSPVATGVPQQPVSSPTPLPTVPATSTPSPARATARPRPTAAPIVAAAPPHLQFVTLRPVNPLPGAPLTANVGTSGDVRRVELYLGSGSPSAPPPSAYVLARTSAQDWTAGLRAPTVAGIYHYTVGLYDHTGRRIVVDNDSWNIQVASPAPTAAPAAQAVPDDIPFAPPFSYGNPVPAVFTVDGRSVNGAEVVSTPRSDVTASAVAQFYDVRLPRAGWTVEQPAEPAAGATSFTVVGTKPGAAGTRVCLVEFDSGVVHIFYGAM